MKDADPGLAALGDLQFDFQGPHLHSGLLSQRSQTRQCQCEPPSGSLLNCKAHLIVAEEMRIDFFPICECGGYRQVMRLGRRGSSVQALVR
jgi:hypothetical protein